MKIILEGSSGDFLLEIKLKIAHDIKLQIIRELIDMAILSLIIETITIEESDKP